MGHIQRNYHNFKLLSYLFLSVGLVFVLASCSTSESSIEVVSQTAPATQTATKLPTTATPTNIPATATPTATYTPTGPTATPKIVPTLNVEQSQLAENFIQGTEDCQLPCWQGIIPGISPSSAVPDFLEKLGISYSLERVRETSKGEMELVFDYYHDYPDIALRKANVVWNESSVSLIRMWAFPRNDSILEVFNSLKQLGSPDVLEFGYTYNSGGIPDYSILMVYEKEQLALSYEGLTSVSSDGVFQMCPYRTSVRAWIFAKGEVPYRDYRLYTNADYWGDMSRYEISKEEFIEILLKSSDYNCIAPPVNVDPIFP